MRTEVPATAGQAACRRDEPVVAQLEAEIAPHGIGTDFNGIAGDGHIAQRELAIGIGGIDHQIVPIAEIKPGAQGLDHIERQVGRLRDHQIVLSEILDVVPVLVGRHQPGRAAAGAQKRQEQFLHISSLHFYLHSFYWSTFISTGLFPNSVSPSL
ncbi:hypothetical protein SDC9_138678 [bioreactor metagenome]|uniref:Uncharacterized protein n=1 Tax=bioreactor metagenome TaxID=1076179 RepID=A0A645DQE4_9ZZZZ